MFELNKSVSAWRQGLLSTGYCTRIEIEELEEHLREEVRTLENKSLSTEEAFIIASKRLGDPKEISREFGKIDLSNFWRSRLLWIVAGILLYLLGSSLCLALYQAGGALSAIAGLTGYNAGISSIVISAICLMTLAKVAHKLALHEGVTNCILNQGLNKKRRSVFIVVIIAASACIPVIQKMLTVITVKVLPVAEIGKLSIVSSVASLALSILLPLVLAIWLLNNLVTMQRRLT